MPSLRGLLAALGELHLTATNDGVHTLRLPPSAVEGFAVLLLYSLGELAFEAAGPATDEPLAASEVLRGLSFPTGAMRLWLGEVEGRTVGLEVLVHPDGRVTVDAGDRQDLVPGWVALLQGSPPASAYA